MNENKLRGQRDARAYYESQGYASYSRYVKAEDAAKLFLPPISESLSQISSPLPKDRRDWIEGFREEQRKIRND